MAVRYKLAAAPEAKVFLQEWRETKFSTQQALSAVIDLPAPTISRYETGEREWGKGYLEALAYAVGCSVPDLFVSPSRARDASIRTDAEILAVLERIEGLTQDDVSFLLKNIKFARAENAEQKQTVPHDQPEPGTSHHGYLPSRK